MNIVLHSSSPSAVFAHVDNRLLLMIWRNLTPQSLEAGAALIRDSKSNKLLMLGIIEEHTKLPDSTFRQGSAELTSQLDGRLVAVAAVIAKKGLMGTAMRSVITGVTLLSRTKCPTKVFADSDSASVWLTPFAETAGLSLDPSKLAVEIGDLRSNGL